MSSLSIIDAQRAWRLFLMDVLFARNYAIANVLDRVAKNPVVERLLPSLLHVKAVAILDHSLQAWIEENKLAVPKKPYGNDLKGRIDYLEDEAHLGNCLHLHSIRRTRNELAHVPSEAVDWTELDRDVAAIHSALAELEIVGTEMPTWQIFCERDGGSTGEVAKSILTFHYRIGIKEADTLIAEIKWCAHMMDDDV